MSQLERAPKANGAKPPGNGAKPPGDGSGAKSLGLQRSEKIEAFAREIYTRAIASGDGSRTLSHQAEEAFKKAEAFYAFADTYKAPEK